MKDIKAIINEEGNSDSKYKHFYTDLKEEKKLGMSDNTLKKFDDIIEKK